MAKTKALISFGADLRLCFGICRLLAGSFVSKDSMRLKDFRIKGRRTKKSKNRQSISFISLVLMIKASNYSLLISQ